jgi:hypothetical protein
MKTGRTIKEVTAQIKREHESKRDYLIPTQAMEMVVGEHGVQLGFKVGGNHRLYAPTKLCVEEIADRTGIPRKYAERMTTEAPGLLAKNVNHWFTNKPEKRMLRTLNNGVNVARAFLSERYRPLDNHDLALVALPRLEAAGCEIRSCEVTETRFYIQASTPRIQSIIEQETRVGGHHQINRTIQAGLIIGNSEVGCGSIFVEPILYDLVCTNGLILQRTLRRHHVGRCQDGNEFASELFTDDTKRLDDTAFWAKVGDVVSGAMDQIKFNENIERLRATQKEVLAEKPKEVEEVVEVTSNRFSFSDDEKAALRLHFASGGDYSKYGLINAVTRTAEDVGSYDRAVELERLGGQIIELPKSDFTRN